MIYFVSPTNYYITRFEDAPGTMAENDQKHGAGVNIFGAPDGVKIFPVKLLK